MFHFVNQNVAGTKWSKKCFKHFYKHHRGMYNFLGLLPQLKQYFSCIFLQTRKKWYSNIATLRTISGNTSIMPFSNNLNKRTKSIGITTSLVPFSNNLYFFNDKTQKNRHKRQTKHALTFQEWPPRVRLAMSGSETGCEWEWSGRYHTLISFGDYRSLIFWSLLVDLRC